MRTPERILVIVDPTTDVQPALERACRLAEQAEAHMDLFISEYDQSIATDQRGIDSRMAHHRETLERLAAAPRQRGIEVETDARWDRPLDEAVVRKVIAATPDLVFKDTHYHSLIRRTLLSNTDWDLIRHCPAPLWLVKSLEYSGPARLLAAVDPMHSHDKPAELDHEILATTETLARLMGGEMHVGHVFNEAPMAIAGGGVAPTVPAAAQPSLDVLESLLDAHRKALDALLENHDLAEERVHFERGSIVEALPDLAESLGAHLVVLGAISRSALKRILIGSTAERLLDRLPCDLLVLKPSGFETPVPPGD